MKRIIRQVAAFLLFLLTPPYPLLAQSTLGRRDASHHPHDRVDHDRRQFFVRLSYAVQR